MCVHLNDPFGSATKHLHHIAAQPTMRYYRIIFKLPAIYCHHLPLIANIPNKHRTHHHTGHRTHQQCFAAFLSENLWILLEPIQYIWLHFSHKHTLFGTPRRQTWALRIKTTLVECRQVNIFRNVI